MPTTAEYLARLVQAKSDIATAITNKGGTVNSGDGLEEFPADIATIPTGGGGVNTLYTTSCKPYTVLNETESWEPTSFKTTENSINALEIWIANGQAFIGGTNVLNPYTDTWEIKQWNNAPGTYIQRNGIWKDANGNVYYSYYSYPNQYHYSIDTDTGTWTAKVWTGLPNASVYGQNFWTDGTNTYYSNGIYQLILDSSTSTWTAKTWNGLTDFDGQYIWKDINNNIYLSRQVGTMYLHYTLNTATNTWSTKTWNMSNFYGANTLNYNNNTYTGDNSYNWYVLNTSTGNWESATFSFNGTTQTSYMFTPQYCWEYNNNLYINSGSVSSSGILDKQLSTNNSLVFNTKTWFGYSDNEFNAKNWWTDGTNIYYSNSSQQYVYDKVTNTLYGKTWNGLTYFKGANVWTDGTNIYHVEMDTWKVLDTSTSTWTNVTFSGADMAEDASPIWSDGTNIYWNINPEFGDALVLNTSTRTWSTKTWNTPFTMDLSMMGGQTGIWTDGDNIYFTDYDRNRHAVLDKSTSTWTEVTFSGISSFSSDNIWTDGKDVYLSVYVNGYQHYVLDKANRTWSSKTWTGTGASNLTEGRYIWTDGTNIYSNVKCKLVKTQLYPSILCK